MGLWDAICDNVLCPVGDVIKDVVEGTGRGIDKAVNVVVIDGVCGSIDKVVEVVSENPGKTALVAGVAVVTGGAAFAFAGPIAATLGSAGVLGSASTGTAISALTGAALESASLAALGGGALAAGGSGMAAGATAVAVSGVAVGGVASSVVVSNV
ncbi:Hypothetical protein mma_0981 [Janthinobacterium sp. Marseille]|uniref:Uncharacterized protein n=2 Tax=Herminiimonas TaxID=303379 RepID=A4G2Y6_HERAR|nr:hypothetical protein [Janthinobacterium sp. Marseille]ABR91940.1 Hypothetical protein mma_0981 [Janthinobacterium sp. Marseille]CAL60873.1 hypothetical protein; putative membrane protein [Herminiimonas arsenicoxydans]